MNEINFTLVLLILIAIHLMSAVILYSLLSSKIQRLSECNRNKYVLRKVKTLKDHRLLVVFLPLIGPIIGFATLNGAVLGRPEKGLKVNSPGDSNLFSDSEESLAAERRYFQELLIPELDMRGAYLHPARRPHAEFSSLIHEPRLTSFQLPKEVSKKGCSRATLFFQ